MGGISLIFLAMWPWTKYLLFTPQSYQEYQAFPQKYLNLATPKNIPINNNSLTLRISPKIKRNDIQFCDESTSSSCTMIFIFLKTLKTLTPKNGSSLRIYENIRVPQGTNFACMHACLQHLTKVGCCIHVPGVHVSFILHIQLSATMTMKAG